MVLPAVWLWDRVEAIQGRDLEAVLMHFVFCPFMLWLVRLVLRAVKYFRVRHPLSKLEVMLAVLRVAWWVGVTRMSNWWGGSLGPRLLCELMLCAVVLLIPVVRELSLTNGQRASLWRPALLLRGQSALRSTSAAPSRSQRRSDGCSTP